MPGSWKALETVDWYGHSALAVAYPNEEGEIGFADADSTGEAGGHHLTKTEDYQTRLTGKVVPLELAMDRLETYYRAFRRNIVKEGAEKIVRLLVEKGVRCPLTRPVNGRQSEHLVSPLLMACRYGDPDLVRLMVEKAEADPNRAGRYCRDSAAKRPLEAMLWYLTTGIGTLGPLAHNFEKLWGIVEVLVQLGADPSLEFQSGTEKKSLALLFQLFRLPPVPSTEGGLKALTSGAPSVLLDGLEDPGVTLLGACLEKKNIVGMRVLAEGGADVNKETRMKTSDGNNRQTMSSRAPLLHALLSQQWEAAEILLKANADVERIRKDLQPNILATYPPGFDLLRQKLSSLSVRVAVRVCSPHTG
uniref:Uncharacterized protein n=1 Tax=Chromera velia CCMP2878 TaxID=1169474 RepID=A0A0G4FVA2_9ALVE|eukprot:Cvel_497.t1-p1 / transcript=Cvel_497.t1 / gene=Cvel_497 / organism=Chromera_velia_CCMP2878 / gene_product=hypothetical protein / transcript_product=hypothetical protein / location=Cvel_scaffold15:196622-198576(-) / protein_length=360 / sequence_SO=supercontig / SO=protein_coding / is_pseudo=false